MRRFRTIAALFALLATLSSSLAATPCGATAPSNSGSEDAGSHAGHAGHGASRDGMGHHGGPDTPPVGAGMDCGALMACGNGLRGMAVAALSAAVPSQLDGAPSVAVVEPSSADRTQDPPPPRRDT
jgi:hypothetical protein